MKTEKEKTLIEKEISEKKRAEAERLRALFDLTDLSDHCSDMLEPTELLLEAGWNKHSLFSVTRGDQVFLHKDQSDVPNGYIRVIYHERKYQAALSKSHFKNPNNGK